MRIGMTIKIDVTKLDKARFFKGKSGTYCDLTAFIDTENAGQYGDHGVITQKKTKEESANKVQLPIVGNVQVFWKDSGQQQTQQQGQYYSPQGGNDPGPADFDDDQIPF